jgi:hypothetical protein
VSMSSPNTYTLPPGWSVTAGRETVQTNSAGQNVQGLNFTLSNPAVASGITVFIPYSLMTQTQAVAQIFNERIAGVTAITSLGN